MSSFWNNWFSVKIWLYSWVTLWSGSIYHNIANCTIMSKVKQRSQFELTDDTLQLTCIFGGNCLSLQDCIISAWDRVPLCRKDRFTPIFPLRWKLPCSHCDLLCLLPGNDGLFSMVFAQMARSHWSMTRACAWYWCSCWCAWSTKTSWLASFAASCLSPTWRQYVGRLTLSCSTSTGEETTWLIF